MKHTATVNKNDDIELFIDAYTSEGFGIGRIDGLAVFVPYALKGETVKAHVIKVSKNYAIAKLTEIIKKNDDIRTDVVCSEYYKCGGCDMQHMSYSEQLKFKCDRVKGALTHLGGICNVENLVLPTAPSPSQLRYRNKASFPFSEINGKVCAGFFAPRSHRLIPVFDCPIQLENTVKAMRITEEWANKYKIPAFNEQTKRGILRHLVVRSAEGSLLVTVVTSGSALPFSAELYEMLKSGLPCISGLVHNVNDTMTNVILGQKYKTLFGEAELRDKICGLQFNVRTPSFLQVNHEQSEYLYKTVLDFMNPDGNECICDVYCGIGTISLMLAQHVKHVIGIEYVKEAVEDARKNAIQNGIKNADFLAEAAEAALPKLVAQGERIDVIVIDPPRKGCDPEVIKAIIDSGTNKVIYVSCNPETLARDIKMLTDNDYKLVKVQPVDMFPQTSHVETIVLLQRETL